MGRFLMGEVPLYVEGGVVAACDAQYSTATRKLHARTSAAWVLLYRGTLLPQEPPPLGPYRRPMPRVLRVLVAVF